MKSYLVSVLGTGVEFVERQKEYDIIEEGMTMATDDDIREIVIRASAAIAALNFISKEKLLKIQKELID